MLSLTTFGQIKSNFPAVKFMTYNIKFASPNFNPSWEVRRDMQVELIKQYDPDILCTQEGLKEQIDYLMQALPEYIVVGEGRKGGDDDEHMAIFIKKNKFRLRELQSFQLSETPEIIGSGPEVNPRMVTWVRLAFLNSNSKDKYSQDYRGHWDNTREFYVFNTHFFNGDQELARLNAAKLLHKRISKLKKFGHWNPDRPVILMGDFNCIQGSEPHQILTGSNNGNGLLKDAINQGKSIDWILYNGNARVLKYEEINFNKKGVYPSDHKPIYAEIQLFDTHKKE